MYSLFKTFFSKLRLFSLLKQDQLLMHNEEGELLHERSQEPLKFLTTTPALAVRTTATATSFKSRVCARRGDELTYRLFSLLSSPHAKGTVHIQRKDNDLVHGSSP